jgi:hypothetical protein
MFRRLTSARRRLSEHRDWEKALPRVGKLPVVELHAWWETSVYGLQAAREAHEKSGEALALAEARSHLTGLAAVIEELERRPET